MAEDNKPVKRVVISKPLPPQSSPTDTSNWDDRTFTAPDGKVHIENDDNIATKPAQTTRVILNQQSAEPKKRVRKIRLVLPKNQ